MSAKSYRTRYRSFMYVESLKPESELRALALQHAACVGIDRGDMEHCLGIAFFFVTCPATHRMSCQVTRIEFVFGEGIAISALCLVNEALKSWGIPHSFAKVGSCVYMIK